MKYTNNEINDKIIDALLIVKRDALDIEIKLDTPYKNIQIDSLDEIEFLITLESKFDIAISDTDAINVSIQIDTVNDIKNFLIEKYDILDIKKERKTKIDKINESRR